MGYFRRRRRRSLPNFSPPPPPPFFRIFLPPTLHAYYSTSTRRIKYKSPHATDLSFAKGETIRVTGTLPPSAAAAADGDGDDDEEDDDEDWLVGESLDGKRKGGFPKVRIGPAPSLPALDSFLPRLVRLLSVGPFYVSVFSWGFFFIGDRACR